MAFDSPTNGSLVSADPRIKIVPITRLRTKPEKVQPPPQTKVSNGSAFCCCNKKRIPAAGIILAIFSSFSFSIAIFLVKVVKSADAVLFVIYRGYFQVFLFTSVAIYKGQSIRQVLDRKTTLCLCLTGLFGSIQQVTSYYAITFIPVADGTAVLLSAPVFVSIFACVLLKEKCGLFQIVTVLLALIGVFLVCRPSFIFGEHSQAHRIDPGHRLLGFGLVGLGCILMAAMYITLRKATHVPFAITNAVLAIFSIVVGVVFTFLSGRELKQPSCGWDSTFVVSSAVLGTVGMLLFVLATQIEHAGPVSVARSSEIVFAFCWQMSLLGDIPSWTSLLGATAVVSSVALIGFQKWADSKKDKPNPFKQCFAFCKICREENSESKTDQELEPMRI